jgi:probable phosphoglycerate mutase
VAGNSVAGLVLVRHGATDWSATGRHTGRTDVPLNAEGEEQARRLGAVLRHERFDLVLASPLRRARRTAELAGLGDARDDDDLLEWDYGGYEGLTTPEIRARLGRRWTVIEDGVVAGDTPGETIEDVAARADRVLARVRPLVDAGGDVALVAHGHYLRILTCRWLGFEPRRAAHLILDAGAVSRLGHEHGTPAISWCNVGPR